MIILIYNSILRILIFLFYQIINIQTLIIAIIDICFYLLFTIIYCFLY